MVINVNIAVTFFLLTITPSPVSRFDVYFQRKPPMILSVRYVNSVLVIFTFSHNIIIKSTVARAYIEIALFWRNRISFQTKHLILFPKNRV